MDTVDLQGQLENAQRGHRGVTRCHVRVMVKVLDGQFDGIGGIKREDKNREIHRGEAKMYHQRSQVNLSFSK